MHLDAFHSVIAEALDGGDAVLGVQPKLLNNLIGKRQLLVAGTEMPVGIDEPGHDGLAGDIESGRSRGNFDGLRGTHCLNAAVADHQRRALEWRPSSAVDQPPAGQDDERGGRCLRE